MTINLNNIQNSGTVALNEMEFFAFHGVGEIEQKIGRFFLVSISFGFDFEAAAIEKNLNKTADYATIYQLVKNEMEVTEKLLETVARRIAWSIKNSYPKSHDIHVIIKKLAPFVGGKCHSAQIGYNLA